MIFIIIIMSIVTVSFILGRRYEADIQFEALTNFILDTNKKMEELEQIIEKMKAVRGKSENPNAT